MENTVQIDYKSGVTHDVGLALKKIHNKHQGGKKTKLNEHGQLGGK